MSDFDRAFDIVIDQEGGYVDDPKDPGGKTRYGITEAVARANGYQGDMRLFPIEHAKTIYREDYWTPSGCDEYQWPLSMYVFDAAVNQGVKPAVMMLQHAIGTVQDGLIGPTTKRLAKDSKPWHWARFMAFRTQRYTSTRNYDRFGEGWLIRLFTVAQSG